MKAMIKKLALPVGVFAVAIAGAFASNLSKQPADPNHRDGYKLVDQQCIKTELKCTVVNTGQMCEDSSFNQLYEWNGTTCGIELYKITP